MSRRILVVEDEEDIRDTVLEILRDADYEAVGAENGREALNMLSGPEPLPGAILLDLRMPVMDGVEFRQEQVKDPRLAGIPVLIVSANARVGEVAQQLGVSGFLRKPFDLGVLLKTLKKTCAAEG